MFTSYSKASTIYAEFLLPRYNEGKEKKNELPEKERIFYLFFFTCFVVSNVKHDFFLSLLSILDESSLNEIRASDYTQNSRTFSRSRYFGELLYSL